MLANFSYEETELRRATAIEMAEKVSENLVPIINDHLPEHRKTVHQVHTLQPRIGTPQRQKT